MPTIITDTSTVQFNHLTELEVTNLEYEQQAAELWTIGRAKRGLAMEDPFEGNSTERFTEHSLHMGNHLAVMFNDGRIDEQTAHRARILLHDLFTMARTSAG